MRADVSILQGRLLPLPELIPFRLTRDIVDGMGVAGTAGVFSRCCEETLLVLRENRQALLAVVDVSIPI
jgi:ataxia telangiectasia mutated family protein